MTAKADIGLIGLAVMGQNLILNMNDHGFTVAVYNRTTEKVTRFVEGEAKGRDIIGTYTLADLCAALKRPRRVMLMVQAGRAVDVVIEQLLPHLEPGDIVIDGGNSNYEDSRRRAQELEAQGFLYAGVGVSGGEEGARFGPSIMPGGSPAAWPHLKLIFQSIAAKVSDGTPCCDWLGRDGAGHFVKMVHNGIEYGDMQLISEAFHLLQSGLGMDHEQMSAAFRRWNDGPLDSYLIEITGDILAFRDEDGDPLVEKILDAAGQKGTGRWVADASLEHGTPLTLISEAVFARFLSALKDERLRASAVLSGPNETPGAASLLLEDVEQALYASKIISYTQGYMLLHAVDEALGWELNHGSIAQMWREGCIIRSGFLDHITAAWNNNPQLGNLLLDDYFREQIENAQTGWRRVVAWASLAGIPVPAMSSALSFYDGFRHKRLPANLLQAQRDYFGAHTYERVDRPRGEHFHTNWTGTGGDVTAGSYKA